MDTYMCSGNDLTRRGFLHRSILSGGALCLPLTAVMAQSSENKKAQIAVSLDLEMARNFPRWEDTRWDYEKGNLTDETKAYAVEAARRVKAHGGRIHFFLVCRALEQESVD